MERNRGRKASPVSPAAVRDLRRRVWAYYRAHGRDLPWRRTRDPYRILVSEIMLQQTQVARVEDYYRRFLKRFSKIDALAAAPLAEILQLWQGLGYNRRAKFLHAAAREIMDVHGGRVPRSLAALRALPGVGPYTAAAVRAFAFDEPEALVETNIRRALLHELFPGRGSVTEGEIQAAAKAVLDAKKPREWHYALMDYGAFLAKGEIENPNRRARNYRRQSSFEGSIRQARGKILRVLLSGGEMPLRGAEAAFGLEPGRVRAAIEGLEKEGFVVRRRGKLMLA